LAKLPKTVDPIRAAAVKAASALSYAQRLTIEALLHCLTKKDAIARLKAASIEVDDKVLSRWLKNTQFQEALQARSDQIAARVTKNSVLLNAQKIMEEALTPKPILHRGEATGFEEIQLGSALAANEQVGKILGAFNKDESGKQIVVIDIDFSGGNRPVQEHVVGGAPVIEGEFTEAPQLDGDVRRDIESMSKREVAQLKMDALGLQATDSSWLD
jgi:hypothetical protein